MFWNFGVLKGKHENPLPSQRVPTFAMTTELMSDSRQKILGILLENKAGMTVDDLVADTGLSRTAVNQHLSLLERSKLVRRSIPKKTAGRPVQVYVLTDEGANVFPKQYSWFSALLVSTLREEMGSERFASYMFELGMKTSAGLIPRLVGKTRIERIIEIVRIMNEAGFQASELDAGGIGTLPRVRCTNCVYHNLTRDYPEVCRFDIGFLSGLMGAEVEHLTCMQNGNDACSFRFKPFA